MRHLLTSLFITLFFATSVAQNTDSVYNTKNSAQTLLSSKSGNLLMAAYGEVHYNQGIQSGNIQNGNLDMHREVLLFGYKFNTRTSFITEIEIEHINEVYLEQGFLNYQLKPWINLQGGLLLIPMGIVNEYHEPTTFNGVERPTIDNVLVPSTWREIGAGFTGNLPNQSLRYQIFAVNGPLGYDGAARLKGKSPIRSARQKGAKAAMRQPDLSAKVNYYGVRGLNIGAAIYMGTTESSLFSNVATDSISQMAKADSSVVGVTMVGLDYRYSKKNFESRGQMIYGAFSNTSAFNQFATSDLGSASYGYYLECGYNISKLLRMKQKFVPFVRYSNYNTHFETTSETTENPTFEKTIVTTGLTFYLDKSFVAKADYQYSLDGNDKTSNQFNLGLGFWFR
ncbi:MAG: hypothetical protein ACI9JN_001885 [Bacteroidia bacterium]|jgi:hypothetical protein